MKKLGWLLLAASIGGCGGVTRQELDAVRTECLAHDDIVAGEIRKDITGTKEKYILVQEIEQRVQKMLDEMIKLKGELSELSKAVDARANTASGTAVKALQFEEKMMSERLAELRALIEELKKK